jgi:hypothetical protein
MIVPRNKQDLFEVALAASFFYLSKEVPAKLLKLAKEQLFITLTVKDEEPAYNYLEDWLNKIKTDKIKNFSIEPSYLDANRIKLLLKRDNGKLSFIFNNKKIICYYDTYLEDDLEKKLIKLVVRSNNKAFFIDLLKRVEEDINGQVGVEILTYRNGWATLGVKTKRPLNTIFLPKDLKENLIKDIENFLSSKEFYTKRGIPYQRGILLQGPPGTGKSSLAIALASHFEKPVYALSLASVGDEGLVSAILEAPSRAIVLIEDVDAVSVTHNRNKKNANDNDSLNLSTFLNVLDGPLAKEDRLLIMTTNHPEKLDPALLRPGRIDRIVEIGYLTPDLTLEMCCAFLDKEKGSIFAGKLSDKPIMSAATLQEMLLKEIFQK